MKDITGVNKELMDKLVIDLQNQKEDIISTLNDIEDYTKDIGNDFDNEIGQIFQEKLSSLTDSFPKINTNLEIYITDLTNSKQKRAKLL